MRSRYVRLTLRIVGALLVVFAAVVGVRGGLSFTAQPEFVSGDTYTIRHTLILPHSFTAVAALGVLLFGASFLIRSRPRNTRTI